MRQDQIFGEVTIDTFKDFLQRHSLMILRNPGGDLFQHPKGLMVDIQSINVICTVYDNLSPANQEKFNTIIMQDEYKFALFLDKMWDWVN